MALVAYSDNSDLGTDSEDGEETHEDNILKASAGKASPGSAVRVSPARLTGGVDSIEDEDDVGGETSSSDLFSSVPSAVPITSLLQAAGGEEEEEDEVVDVPTVETWKVTQELKLRSHNEEVSLPGAQHATVNKKKDRKRVQILLPSLSKFADEDDEEEEMKEPPRKKVNPSSSASGLFAVLPEPKHAPAKEAGRSLVPHILTKRPPEPHKSHRRVQKRPADAAAVHVVGNVSDEDEDDETGTSDFFSLLEAADTSHSRVAGELAANHVSSAHAPILKPLREDSRVPCNQPEEPPHVLEQHHNYKEERPSIMTLSPSGPTAAAAVAAEAAAAAAAEAGCIDEATILRLAGKRGRAEAISFIDVNADDALLTRQEWMTKALSEEKPQHGFSRKREGLPTQKQKQKHQITYLAHQAKERELDLKNTWAQNRMTKMQSQAKYGF